MTSPDANALRTYHVVADGRTALELELRPGHLYSMAAPPQGYTPPAHPFINGVSHSPMHEHVLRQHLLASADANDFLVRLVLAGFDIAHGAVSQWAFEGQPRRILRDGQVVGVLFSRMQGPLATLWGFDDPTASRHTLVTVYSQAHAASLESALDATTSSDTLIAALTADGYTFG